MNEFARNLAAAMAEAERSPDTAVPLLEDQGFLYGAKSAKNLRLLGEVFSPETLAAVARMALLSPLPDMALNGLERIASLLPRETLPELARRGNLARLITICGSSPFLTNIICRDASRYIDGLFLRRQIGISRSEEEMLAALREETAGADYAELQPLLRRFKHEEILRIATRDLCGLSPLEEVTAELASLAAAALQVAYEGAYRKLVGDYGVPIMRTPEGDREAEMTIIGMGKLGGRELNFSSDIDIIFFHSSDHGETAGLPDGRGRISLHEFFAKAAEMVTKGLSQVTGEGFVFRVDLGLRPEGKSGDLVLSQRSAEIYYESWGQPWERTAMLKARPVAGSIELGNSILKSLEPFVYRRYLDYTLIEDMMSMKKKIDASLVREREGETNIKLGRGGIREIEFFIQALQLVYAGKNPELRERNSLQALQKLRRARLISDEDADALSEAYRFLRTVEHRIQVVQERQTHNLPVKPDEYEALARRCGFLRRDGAERFTSRLEGHRARVSEIYGNLFLLSEQKLKEEVGPEVYHFLEPKADADLVKDLLAERGFRDVDAAYRNLLVLRDGPPRGRLTERGRRTLEKIAPLLLQQIFDSSDPEMALANMERFLASIGARSSYYSLLAENREVLKLLVSMFGMSEFLSKIFIAHPELLDGMVSHAYSSFRKGKESLETELAELLAKALLFEDRLDVLRRFRHEEFLRIGMNDIYGKLGQSEIAGQLTDLAEATLETAYLIARDDLSRFGRPRWIDEAGKVREARFAVLAMGKMGGRELNYHSDLDIIYIYDRQGETDRPKSISNHEYFAKLGQRIISVLTTTTREGYAYKIDTRLRPSGNAGPLVTSVASFREYHRTEAQIWERQALTKARALLGDEGFRSEIEGIVAETVYGRDAGEAERAEIHRLRMRMENELAREKEGSYNIKTGRGGMVDVEFVVQFLQLRHGRDREEIRTTSTVAALKAIRDAGILPVADAATLLEGYKFLRRLENRLRIIHDYSINDLGGSPEYIDKLARRLGYDPKLRRPGEALMKDYEETTGKIRQVYEKVFEATE
jgi:[glutamine synthetase] adenylyltransferase / [glutamine synthetase]-adenylyl-L-tyrosine phosphorylase